MGNPQEKELIPILSEIKKNLARLRALCWLDPLDDPYDVIVENVVKGLDQTVDRSKALLTKEALLGILDLEVAGRQLNVGETELAVDTAVNTWRLRLRERAGADRFKQLRDRIKAMKKEVADYDG